MSDNKFVHRHIALDDDERREITAIKNRYSDEPLATDKLTELRKLDGKVKNPPMIWSLVLGIVGILVFGLGLTMILEWLRLILGIAVMLAGCAVMVTAYPTYNLLFARGKKKYGEKIMRLSEELLGENETNDRL